MATRKLPIWTKSTPGQYGSNGINTDGSCMNVGNTLGERPSIKLFPKYNSGTTMRTLLADCGGLGDGLHSNKNITEHNSVSTLQKKPKSASTLEVQRSLWEAARQGNTQLVKSALYDGADVMKPNPADGWLALHYAVSNNRRLTCKFLLSLPSAIQQCTYCNKIGEVPIKLCTDGFLKNILQNISDQ